MDAQVAAKEAVDSLGSGALASPALRVVCILVLLAVFLGGALYMDTPAYVLAVVGIVVAVGVWRPEYGLVVLALSYSYALPLIRTPIGWSAFVRPDDVAITAVLVSWILVRRGRLRELLPESPLTRPLLAWTALLAVSTAIGYVVHGETRALVMGALGLVRTVEFTLVYLVVISTVKGLQQADRLLKALWVGALGVAGFSIFMWSIGACIPLEGWARAVAPNTSVLSENYCHHGVYMLLAVMLLQTMLLRERGRSLKVLLALSICLGAFSLALSTSRTAYVGLAAASAVAAVLWSRVARPRVGVPVAIVPLGLVLGLVVLLPARKTVDIAVWWEGFRKQAPAVTVASAAPVAPPSTPREGVKGLKPAHFKLEIARDQTVVAPRNRVAKTGAGRSSEVDFGRRLRTWNVTLTQLIHKPWRLVTGVGFMRFRFDDLGAEMSSGHNNFVQVIGELGLPGLAILLWGAWSLMGYFVGVIRRPGDPGQVLLASGLLAACIGLGVTAIVQETFYPQPALSSFGGYFLFVMGVGVSALRARGGDLGLQA